MFLKVSYSEELFIDQNSELLVMEDEINITLLIKVQNIKNNMLFNST